MTEAEAATKWCPFSRDTNFATGSPAFNRVNGVPAAVCVGSACMAWRWDEEPVPYDLGYTTYESVTSKTEGHCGLVRS